MVENWIDALCKRWATVNPSPGTSGAFGARQVRSYNLVTDTDFPDVIKPEDLARVPIALTYPPSLRPLYSLGGPRTATWHGHTEFHLAPGLERGLIRELLPWYKAIWNAAAGSPQLDGAVELFALSSEDDAMSELLAMQYGQESLHWGIDVKWWVKEHVETQITVGGPGT